MSEFFQGVDEVRYEGPDSDTPFAFKVYDPHRVVLGKTMEDQLRAAVCYWHTFTWPGSDVFGSGTFDRPWIDSDMSPMDAARMKMDAAFEFFEKLGTPFFCFHDIDIAPAGTTFAETRSHLHEMVDYAAANMERTGVRRIHSSPSVLSSIIARTSAVVPTLR